MNFRQEGKKSCFGDIVHDSESLQHPEVTAIFDIDQTAAAATRINCWLGSRRECLIARRIRPNPAWSLAQEGSGYSGSVVLPLDGTRTPSPQKVVMLRGKPTAQVGPSELLDPAIGNCFAAEFSCEVTTRVDQERKIYGGLLWFSGDWAHV